MFNEYVIRILFSLGMLWIMFPIFKEWSDAEIRWLRKGLLVIKSTAGKILIITIGLIGMQFILVKQMPNSFNSVFMVSHSSQVAIVAGVIIVVLFQEQLLPKINERLILITTLVFWYLALAYTKPWTISINDNSYENIAKIAMLSVLLIISIPILVNSFVKKNISDNSKAALYVWYLVMMVLFSWMYIKLGVLKEIPFNELSIFNLINGFMAGMMVMYLFTLITPLLLLIPGDSHGPKEIKEELNILSSRYSDEQTTKKDLILSAIIIVLLILNGLFKFVSIQYVISITIFVAVYLIAESKDNVPESASQNDIKIR
jgi:hypothetical protein